MAWKRLAANTDRDKLKALTTVIALKDVIEAGKAILEGKVPDASWSK